MTTFMPQSVAAEPPRGKLKAMGRGLIGRCPECGQGEMFRAYLKVNDTCSICHTELHHQRADDAPPYITMFIVGHIVVTLVLAVQVFWIDPPFWLEALVWSALTAVLCLVLLPRVKGALVGLQWSLRMHGFGAAAPVRDGSTPTI